MKDLRMTCPECQGRGEVREYCRDCYMRPITTYCPKCGNSGVVGRTACQECGGTGEVENAIGQGSAACGASPALTGCASNGSTE